MGRRIRLRLGLLKRLVNIRGRLCGLCRIISCFCLDKGFLSVYRGKVYNWEQWPVVAIVQEGLYLSIVSVGVHEVYYLLLMLEEGGYVLKGMGQPWFEGQEWFS